MTKYASADCCLNLIFVIKLRWMTQFDAEVIDQMFVHFVVKLA